MAAKPKSVDNYMSGGLIKLTCGNNQLPTLSPWLCRPV